MDPVAKVDYSRHIREASVAMDGLPEGVPPSGRVPGQLPLAAPILKWRRRWYREENGNRRSILGVSSAGTKYRPKGAPRGATGQPGGCLARPRAGPRQGLFWSSCGGPPILPWCFRRLPDADFLYNFSGIFGALLMAGKPEIQKQQKTGTGNWVHRVNRLVQICSIIYGSSRKTWQSHTKHAWSKQKLKIRLGRINIPK